MLKTIEVDRWNYLYHLGMIKAKDAFDQLEKHLKEHGLLPDEFIFLEDRFKANDGELPIYLAAICQTNFGENEGIDLDISLKYEENGEFKYRSFAMGKTLGDTVEAFQRMARIGAECSMMLNGRGANIMNNLEQAQRDNQFLRVLEPNLKALGVTYDKKVSGNKEDVKLSLHGEQIGYIDVSEDNTLYLKRNEAVEPTFDKIKQTFRDTSEAFEAYASAMPLEVQGEAAQTYRKLCEMNGVVLAAKMMQDKALQFVTWRRTSTGVEHGNYTHDYEAAKKDFALRAELVDERRLFDDKELSLIGSAIELASRFSPMSNKQLTYDEERSLESITEKIGAILSLTNTQPAAAPPLSNSQSGLLEP